MQKTARERAVFIFNRQRQTASIISLFSPFGLRRIRRSIRHPPVKSYRFSVRMMHTRLLISFVTSSTLFSPEKYADASSMMTL